MGPPPAVGSAAVDPAWAGFERGRHVRTRSIPHVLAAADDGHLAQTHAAEAVDPYALAILICGLALLGAAWLPRLSTRIPVSTPIVYVALGALLYALPLPLPPPDPLRYPDIAEGVTELAMVVVLASVGLRIDTRFGWRRWSLAWRLLGITKPLTLLAVVWLGLAWLGLDPAAAMLLAAVLAPTDPTFAGGIHMHAHDRGGAHPVKFALASEAGLNDGLAFPFVWLAIAMALAGSGTGVDWGRWLAMDVLWRGLGGIAIGLVVAGALMRMVFPHGDRSTLSRNAEGLAALAISLAVYGLAELCHTYGFLAVFVAAVVVRQQETRHHHRGGLESFARQCEKLLVAVVLLLLGGALASGLLSGLGWREVAFALVLVLVVRPLAGLAGLMGTSLTARDRCAISLFGVRGIGPLFYLAFALDQADFGDPRPLWSVVCLVVALSILVHGLVASGARIGGEGRD